MNMYSILSPKFKVHPEQDNTIFLGSIQGSNTQTVAKNAAPKQKRGSWFRNLQLQWHPSPWVSHLVARIQLDSTFIQIYKFQSITSNGRQLHYTSSFGRTIKSSRVDSDFFYWNFVLELQNLWRGSKLRRGEMFINVINIETRYELDLWEDRTESTDKWHCTVFRHNESSTTV